MDPAPGYLTTNELMARVSASTGKPCKSRNRPALLKKLGMPGEIAGANPVTRKTDDIIANAQPAGGEPAKRAAVKAKPVDPVTFVRKALARKAPPTLRELCEELHASGIKTPRGRKTWWPSSVQNIIRKIDKEQSK